MALCAMWNGEKESGSESWGGMLNCANASKHTFFVCVRVGCCRRDNLCARFAGLCKCATAAARGHSCTTYSCAYYRDNDIIMSGGGAYAAHQLALNLHSIECTASGPVCVLSVRAYCLETNHHNVLLWMCGMVVHALGHELMSGVGGLE